MSPEREPMENDSNSRTAEELEQQTVDVYVERALHGPVFRMSYEHTHTYCEIFYLKSGTCTYTVNQGQYGLVALEPAWISSTQIEAARVAMTRYIKRGGKVWIKIFPDKPVTAKPAETRMGSGKGALEYWVAVVKPGRVMFEIAGVSEEIAREALRLAMHKLPCKCKIVSRAELEGGDNSEN